jgi:hypothetical protein
MTNIGLRHDKRHWNWRSCSGTLKSKIHVKEMHKMKKTVYAIDLTSNQRGFAIEVYRAAGSQFVATSVIKKYRSVSTASAQRVARLMNDVTDNLPIAFPGGLSVLGVIKAEFRS